MIPKTMHAVQLTGHGGLDMLSYRTDVPVPVPAFDEVLIRVTAAGVNNTDINTRIGWYSKSVTADTNLGGSSGIIDLNGDDASWAGVPLVFPRIQGADVSGHIVAVGKNVDPTRIGERILARTMMQDPKNSVPFYCWTMGSECDGGFAQYCKTKSSEAFAINSAWSDIELASIPCAYSTAENMLNRVDLGAERVLITGASGGVGLAAVQLAKRRGCQVIAQVAASKANAVMAAGASRIIHRNDNPAEILGIDAVDVVVDLVAGPSWPNLLDIIARGGRYVTAGAIAGPIVELDVRTLYLKDLTLLGATYQDKACFQNLISYIENNEIKPIVAASLPLKDIKKAQKMFLGKNFVGKIVLTIP
jgi:NADPH:quinone reductase-like Zn-dependent oxidoreductase|tara:strand:+ start:858 stop:1940 length:1083 start_codon:yes stop_codon:yes gene_type:complete